jgi:hypothetical protein
MATEIPASNPIDPPLNLLEGPQREYPDWCGALIAGIFHNEIRLWLEGSEASGFRSPAFLAARRVCRAWRDILMLLPVIRTTRSSVYTPAPMFDLNDRLLVPGRISVHAPPYVANAQSERLFCDSYCHIDPCVRMMALRGVNLRYLKITGYEFGDREIIEMVNGLIIHERAITLDNPKADIAGPVVENLVPNLEHLTIVTDSVTSPGTQAISCIIRACSILRTLTLIPRHWDQDSSRAIADAVIMRKSLRDVAVGNLEPFITQYETLFLMASNGLRSFTARFDCMSERIDQLRIFGALSESTTLEHVRLRCPNGMDMDRLARSMLTRPPGRECPLKSLCIGCSHLSRSEVGSLTEFLDMPNCNLRHLCVNLTMIDWPVAEAFFGILRDHRSLRRVVVNAGYAYWTQSGEFMRCIAHTLRFNKVLTCLTVIGVSVYHQLSGNYLEEEPRLRYALDGPCITW